jgi:hypothetical protein
LDRGGSDNTLGLACISPWYGVGEGTFHITEPPHSPDTIGWKVFWLMGYTWAAFLLTLGVWRTFDRCLGRMADQGSS